MTIIVKMLYKSLAIFPPLIFSFTIFLTPKVDHKIHDVELNVINLNLEFQPGVKSDNLIES